MAHHYVPRFYLKNFAFNEEETLVYSMSRDYTIHDKPSKISKICAKKNYNTPEQERAQSSLESEYAEKLRNLIQAAQGKYNFSIVDEFINNTFAKLWCVGLSRYLMNSTDSTEMFSDLVNNNRIRFLRKYF